jgi:hypothetical protein
MGLVSDLKQGPVANVNAITNNAIDRLRDEFLEAIQQIGPEAEALGVRVQAAFAEFGTAAINQTEQAGEKLEDHAVPWLMHLTDHIFDRICRIRVTIDIGERP